MIQFYHIYLSCQDFFLIFFKFPCCKMKCNTKDMSIGYTRVAKNSIQEDEYLH